MRVFKKIEGYTFWPGILVEEWRRSVRKRKVTIKGISKYWSKTMCTHTISLCIREQYSLLLQYRNTGETDDIQEKFACCHNVSI